MLDIETNFLSELNLEQIKDYLHHAVPEIPDVGNIKLLGDGFSSYVLLANSIILRIAKTAEAMNTHTREWRLLPRLKAYLPCQIPEPVLRLTPAEPLPFGAIGYPAIAGVPFSLDLIDKVKVPSLAQQVAEFLLSLHQCPPDVVQGCDLDATSNLEAMQDTVMPRLQTDFSADDCQALEQWWNRYHAMPVKVRVTPTLIHGDCWGENLILKPTLDSLVGVIDFEATTIGDIAQDFAGLRYFGTRFLAQAITHYQTLGGDLGQAFPQRLAAAALLREITGLYYALTYPEAGELMDSLSKVRQVLRTTTSYNGKLSIASICV